LVVKESAPFEIVNTGWEFPNLGTFTLSRSKDNSTSFSQKLLADQKEKVVVLVYDQWLVF
jgi:hypothetical protein